MTDSELNGDLAALLGPRSALGWRWEAADGIWCFGLAGAALLVANVDGGRLHLFDHDADEDLYFETIDQLAAALSARERARRGFTPLQREILESDIELDGETLARYHAELAEQDRAFDGRPA